MPIQVQIGDTGQIAEFPDGTPVATIEAALQARLGIQQPVAIQQQPAELAQPTAQQPAQQDLGPLDFLAASAQQGGAFLTGALAQPISGLAGLAATPFVGAEEGGRVVRDVQEALTFQPDIPGAQAGLQVIGETVAPVVDPIAEAQQEFVEGAESPLGASLRAVAPEAALALTPFIGPAFKQVRRIRQSPLVSKISANPGDKQFVRSMVVGADRVAKDKAAIESIKQGFDEGIIAAVKGATPIDRAKMLKMVQTVKQGKADARVGLLERPADIAGKSALERIKHIKRVNRSAGQRLNAVANGLKGKPVDVSPAVDGFISSLDEMGVTLVQKKTGKVVPNFSGSIIEGVKGSERAIKNLVNRMVNTKSPDAFDAHRLKKFIDEQVTFGKTKTGLGGRTESVMKKLRRDIDGILDSNFKEYDRVNSTFSETINALDDFQSAAGGKVDLFGPNSDKAVGTVLRRIMSNTQSRVNLLDSLDDLEKVAKKTGGKFKDDVITQMMFVDELDSVFGPAAKTSLAGETRKAIKAATDQRGLTARAIDVAGEAAEKARGINEAGAFKAIEELLKRGAK